MIRLLPKWILTDIHPGFYDSENGTILEQTAHIYGKMNELIEEYNKFADDINISITNYVESDKKDNEEFKTCLISLVNNYIKTIDMKIDEYNLLIKNHAEQIKEQDVKIDDLLIEIRNNLDASIQGILDEMVANGTLDETILNSIGSLNTKYDELDSRVVTLENTTYVLKHDIVTEELILEKVIGGE